MTASALLRPADFALRAATIDRPLAFGRSDAEDLRLLRLLREATSHAVNLTWRLSGAPSVPMRAHTHLIPPAGGVDAAATEYAAAWAASYSYGSYYYRCGPDFVTVRDTRPGGDNQRLVIADGAAEFLHIAQAERLDDLQPAARRAVPDAVAAGLVLVADGAVLALPYRMRHWPVPHLAV